MHGREKRVLLREYLSRGVSMSALASKLGIGPRQSTTGLREASWIVSWTMR